MNTEGYHCTPVHLTFDKDKLKIFTIDAADAPSITYMQFLFQLEDIKDIEKEINAHQPTRRKEKMLIKFKYPNSAQCTLSLIGKVRNIFAVNVGRYTKTAPEQRIAFASAKTIWDEATQRLLAV